MEGARSFILLVSRILISAIFILAGINKFLDFEHTSQYMASKQMTNIPAFLYAAALIELLCGISVLLGLWARAGALILALYLVPVTLIFHDFWNVVKPEEQQFQMIHFFMNWAIVGGLLYVFCFGSGSLSLRRS